LAVPGTFRAARRPWPWSVWLVELAGDERELCPEEHCQLLLDLAQRGRGDAPHDGPVDVAHLIHVAAAIRSGEESTITTGKRGGSGAS
ncbi:hypothetical protein, partial [Frankia sp. CiP3]|uniref:hypothetical protein n=1 Tax=Frankia sp. CiP3 TaxID=2880971 RepID=UPI001EF74018